MGSLSNLYISASYTSLAHLGTDNALSIGTMTLLQDGIGQSLNISFDGANISSSGNIYGANITGSQFNTGSLVTTSSFNSYTSSTNARLSSIETTTASLNNSVSALNTNSASVNSSISNLNTATASFSSSINQLNASSASQQSSINAINVVSSSWVTESETGSFVKNIYATANPLQFEYDLGNGGTNSVTLVAPTGSAIDTGSFVTTSSFNSYTSSQDLLNATFATIGGNQTFTGANAFQQALSVQNGLGINGQTTFGDGQILNTFFLQNISGSLVFNKIATASKVDLQNLSLLVSGTFTSSLQEGYAWVGGVGNVSKLVATSSFGTTINTGSFVNTSSFNSYTSSTNNRLNNLETTSASVNISISNLNTTTASLNNSVSLLNSFTQSQTSINTNVANSASLYNTKWNTLGGQTGSYVTSAITASSLVTASVNLNTITFTKGDASTFNINVNTGSATDISSLNQFTASQLNINSGYNTFTSSTNTSINALNQFTASQSTASLVNSITELNTFSASAKISISALNSATSSYVTETESGSFLITASFDNGNRNLTFTKGDNTTFAVNIPDVSGSAGTFVTTSSFNAYTQSNDQRVTSLESNSASVNVSISNINQTTASLNSSVTQLNASSASQQVSIDSLNAATSSYANSASVALVDANQQSQINSLIAATGSYLTASADITSLNAFTASQLNINTGYNTFTSSANQRLGSLETNSASVNTSISALNTFTASQSTASLVTSITNLNTFTSSQLTINSAIGASTASLNTFSSSVLTQLNTLENVTSSLISKTGSYATTGSNNFIGDQTITGNLTAFSASFTYLQTIYESSSIIYSSGSNQFGDELTDVQTLSGSVKVQGSLTVNGTPVLTSSVDISGLVTTASFNAYTSSNNQRVDSLETNSASVNISISNINSTTASLNSSVSNLNQFTASQTTASIVSSLDNLNTFSASTLIRLTNIESTTASLNTSISNLNTATSSLFTSASLSLVTASFDTGNRNLTFTKGNATTFSVNIPDVSGSSIPTGTVSGSAQIVELGFLQTSSFNSYTSSTNSSITQLNASSASQQISIDALNTNSASVNISISNLNSATSSLFGSASLALVTASVNLNTITFTKGDTSTFNIVVNTGSAVATDITALNSFTSSQETKNSTLASVTSSLNSATASLFTSASLALVTASFSGNTLTFTKGDTSTFGVVIPDISGSTIDTGSFATTGSNTFTGNQLIGGYVKITGDDGAPNEYSLETTKSLRVNAKLSTAGFTLSGSNETEAFDSYYPGTRWQHAGNVDFTNQIAGVGTGSIQISAFGGGNASISGSQTNIASVDFIPFSASLNSRISGLATTGSNTFVGNQTISGAINFPNGTFLQGPTGDQTVLNSPTSSLRIVSGVNTEFYAGQDMVISGSAKASIIGNNEVLLKSLNTDVTISGSGVVMDGWFNGVTIKGSNVTLQGFTYPTTDGTNGQVLTTNGSKVLSFTTVSGSSINTGSFATTGSNNFYGSQNISSSINVGDYLGTDRVFISNNGIQLFNATQTNISFEAANNFFNAGGNFFIQNTLGGIGSGSITMTANNGGNISVSGSETNIAGVNFIPFSASLDSRLTNIQSATASLFTSASRALVTASVSLNTITFTKGDGTTFPITVNTGSGGGSTFSNPSVESISGSLVLTANTFASGSGTMGHLSSSAQNQVNLVFKNKNDAGTTIISGSNNIFSNPSVPSTGYIRYIGGSNNLYLNSNNGINSQITASAASVSGARPEMNNNIFNSIGTFTINQAVNTGTHGYSQNYISGNGNVTINALSHTGSLSLSHNILSFGSITINASSASVAQIATGISGSGAVNVNGNLVQGNGSMTITSPRTLLTTNTQSTLGNFVAGGSITVTNISSSAAVTANNNIANSAISYTNAGAAGLGLHTLAGGFSQNVGGATLIASASSMNFNFNTTSGNNLTVTNQAWSGSLGVGQFNILRNIFYGQSGILLITGSVDGTGNTTGAFTDNAVIGKNNTIFSNQSGANVHNSFISNVVGGEQLIISASNSFNSTIGGGAYFGRYNANDGVRNKTGQTVFSVGTGTSTARKTGLLIDSGSNMFVEGTLNVSGSTSLTGSLTIQSGSSFFANGNKQFNVGAFQSNVTQSGSANVSQSMNFETTDISSGISIASNSRITLANSGTYNIQFSAQLNADTGADTIWIWLKKNGTNVSSTTTKLVLANNEANIAAWNFVVDSAASDYFELAWQNINGHAKLLAEAAAGNYPAIPSIILTVTQVR